MSKDSMFVPEVRALPLGADWRWQDVLDLAPETVMEELTSLDAVLLDLYHAHKDAKRALLLAQAQMGAQEDASVQEAADLDERCKGDANYVALVDGKNQEIRDRRARLYLATVSGVVEARAEVARLLVEADDAEVALSVMQDRQSNLRQWARMYCSTVDLLATIRPPEQAVLEVTAGGEAEVQALYFIKNDEPPLSAPCSSQEEAMSIRQHAQAQGYVEVEEAVWWGVLADQRQRAEEIVERYEKSHSAEEPDADLWTREDVEAAIAPEWPPAADVRIQEDVEVLIERHKDDDGVVL